MGEFLRALSRRLRRNTTAHDNYRRIFVPDREPPNGKPDEPLRVNILFKHIKGMLSGDTAVVAETGDSWFNCQKLRLPEGCGYASPPLVTISEPCAFSLSSVLKVQ